MGKIYFVHCIDTEGPLYETMDATFERVKQLFGIKIDATVSNLEKLQHGEIDLDGKEKEVAKVLDASLICTYKNFEEIEHMLTKLNSKEFRAGEDMRDCNGQGWKCSWFCMDHVGFLGENPRMRIAGYHSIYDWYINRINYSCGDIIQWHYHPLPVNGNYNACGINYVSSGNVFEILARKIIDRRFFPAVYRPGFHTERPDSHWLLEQWIPFDYANQAMIEEGNTEQRDNKKGRLGNWIGAPTTWEPYHPDYEDYRKIGNCKRVIARCLNMNTRLRTISMADFQQAFCEAQKGKDQLVSFTDHDFRDICYDIELMRRMIKECAEMYSDVEFEFCNALEGMRKYFGLVAESCNLDVKLHLEDKNILISAEQNIFGQQPFFCVKIFGEKYIWSNLDFVGDHLWSFTFDDDSVDLEFVEKIGVAANSVSGVTDIIVIDVKTKHIEKRVLNL